MNARDLMGDPTYEASTGGGQLNLWVRPGLLVGQVTGHLGPSLGARIIEASEGVVANSSGSIVGLHDWLSLASYDISVQAELSGYILKRGKRFRRVLIAVESPLVTMGVRTANLVVQGSLEVTKTREAFDAAVRGEVASLSMGAAAR